MKFDGTRRTIVVLVALLAFAILVFVVEAPLYTLVIIAVLIPALNRVVLTAETAARPDPEIKRLLWILVAALIVITLVNIIMA